MDYDTNRSIASEYPCVDCGGPGRHYWLRSLAKWSEPVCAACVISRIRAFCEGPDHDERSDA